MGCLTSKSTKVVGESQKPGEQPRGEEPNLEAGAEAADGQDTSLKDGSPAPKS
ncbi:CHD9 neighbor protein [Mirounga angustirostris]|uniref:CHD9 neighbor protein n=1 Tax=Mirounga angustirostris TaxID=9716 RepID=UPI001E689290|nr:CHD9 neighbor protein [Mirounga angustirostris]